MLDVIGVGARLARALRANKLELAEFWRDFDEAIAEGKTEDEADLGLQLALTWRLVGLGEGNLAEVIDGLRTSAMLCQSSLPTDEPCETADEATRRWLRC